MLAIIYAAIMKVHIHINIHFRAHICISIAVDIYVNTNVIIFNIKNKFIDLYVFIQTHAIIVP